MVKGVEWWGGQKPYFSGDSVPDRENAIVIMNHRTIIDWLFVFGVAGRRGRLGCVKFFAKVRLVGVRILVTTFFIVLLSDGSWEYHNSYSFIP